MRSPPTLQKIWDVHQYVLVANAKCIFRVNNLTTGPTAKNKDCKKPVILATNL